MGCFLGCFGLSSKRKRRKPGYRDHKLGSYEPLDSVSTNFAIAGKPIISEAEHSKRPKDSLNCKVRKKVSFNLNVQTYEPIPKEECTSDYWESDGEETDKDAAKERQSSSLSEGDSIASKMASYPSNYRYGNCIDSYDEEDGIAYEESDLDDDEDEFDDKEEEEEDDDDDDNNGCNIDELRVNQKEFSGQFSSLPASSQNKNSLTRLGKDTAENLKSLGDSNEGGLRSRQYVHSVLKPVENLNQWKAVKARGTQPPKHQRKENVALEQHPPKPLSSISNHSTPLMQEIAVDASLSNWVVPPDSYKKKTASNDVEAKPSKKACLTHSTYSWRDREDMPILDITNLDS
ncbi:hypothetical protein OIU77_014646 [Salix suchowensis]|uniref:Uncharacterized protein n=1 Tax=Salix suchowensis TaxID=1278906 RepID=A0ABQ8ZY13_9ROSI|nr:hypothetical protein OIU77_014646 [Salix suchowensis]